MMFENTLRYSTFADRSQVENRIESYETLMVPSNLLVGGKNAIPPLIHKLYEAGEIGYYIDPSITEFHRGTSFLDGNEIKSWHQKLLEELGEPLSSHMRSNLNLVYGELSEHERSDVIEAVCDFQTDFVQNAVNDQMGKYESALADDITPEAIVPWYIKIDSYDALHANRAIINQSARYCDLPVKPCIHVDKSFISDINVRHDIAEMAANADVDEVFLWVEDLNKSRTDVTDYVNVIRTVVECMNSDLAPHAMYGDFFSNLLTYFGLRGTSFGTYHSEDNREKLEAGGGGNLQRYYFNPVKDFLGIPEATELGETYDAEVPVHSGLDSWDRLFKLGKDHDFLKNHFIRTKNVHRETVLQNQMSDVVSQLESDYNTYAGTLDEMKTTKTAGHLKKWVNSIKIYLDEYPDESSDALATARDRLTTASSLP